MLHYSNGEFPFYVCTYKGKIINYYSDYKWSVCYIQKKIVKQYEDKFISKSLTKSTAKIKKVWWGRQ